MTQIKPKDVAVVFSDANVREVEPFILRSVKHEN